MTDGLPGLDERAAKRLLAENGQNVLKKQRKKGPLSIFLSQFCDVLTVILAAAAVFSVTMGEFTEAVSIIAIMLLNAFMGFIQEYRTERTLEALSGLAAPHATVRRGGRAVKIPAANVVAGDVLLLYAGDRVAADARLLAASSLETDESLLTGESHAIAKQAGTTVYMGTNVAAGRGEAVVTATGMATEMGRIAGLIGDASEGQTPLQHRLSKLGNQIAMCCLAVCGLVAAVGFLRGEKLMDMVLMGLSLAVAAIPEGLPAVVTVVLAFSVGRILKKGAIIRRMHAVESLGSASVICCDKTGTMTENRMAVKSVYADKTEQSPEAASKRGGAARELMLCAALCAAGEESGASNSTERALTETAKMFGIDRARELAVLRAVREQPFDSNKKYMSVTYEHAGSEVTYIKGACDRVAGMSTHLLSGGREYELTREQLAAVNGKASEMGSRALRVMAFARTSGGRMVLLGLAGLYDPPRREVAPAVKRCREMGIRAVMITGDMPETAAAVAREVGIDCKRVITGYEIDAMNDKQLADAAERCSVYARVAPLHKLRLVRAYKRLGMVTVMTGDGVNDAPAVKEADVGVAMGISGTEVTKEAAGVVITDDNFATIVEAVREGRIIYQNIRRFIVYLLACNLGEVLTVVLAMAFGAPQIFVPIQLLLINLITDGLPAIALGLEPAAGDIDTSPPRKRDEGILSGNTFCLIAARGFSLALCNMASFMAVYALTGNIVIARSAAYIVLVFSQMLYVLENRFSRSREAKPFSNPALTGAVALSMAVTLATVYIPPLAAIFGTQPVTGLPLAAAAVCTAVSPFIGIAMRRLVRK